MTPDLLLQRRVLRRLAREFPSIVEVSTVPELDTVDAHGALFFLAEKKFVDPGAISSRPGEPREMLEATITAAGLEWLGGQDTPADSLTDGASPFELEALRHFLKQALECADISAQTKQDAIARLLAFSSADIKALVLRLLRATTDRPDVLVDLISKTGR